MPLLVQPALGRLVPTLQDDVVALQPARKVVPRRGDQRVLALQVADRLLRRRLFLFIILSKSLSRERSPFLIHFGRVSLPLCCLACKSKGNKDHSEWKEEGIQAPES